MDKWTRTKGQGQKDIDPFRTLFCKDRETDPRPDTEITKTDRTKKKLKGNKNDQRKKTVVASRVSLLSVQICFCNSSASTFKEKGSIIESHERPIFWTSIPILDERGRTSSAGRAFRAFWTSVDERARASTFWTNVLFLDERYARAWTSIHFLDERPLLDERFERSRRAWTSVSSVMHERGRASTFWTNVLFWTSVSNVMDERPLSGRASTFWTSVHFLDERPLRAERASLWNERALAM
ncbi:hypothetical protein LR48_Vigan118s001700 [Vigna angularis]|uniref:Uncharacterized protein n=1 Tax=Phaseolus angularis TaxID=3914 RepID=A0A0L9T4R3_PHAAN|nr:hypothetical protein LR48_Vigan118s001700 [Vigna angularis]